MTYRFPYRIFTCALLALNFAFVIPAAAERARVAEATVSPDGLGDYPSIQDAIDAIDSGGVIYLTDGTFSGAGNFNLDFNGKNFELRSQNLVPENCIIDCSAGQPIAEGRPSARGVSFTNSENGLSMLTGLTIRNGNAGTGGAVLINGAHPVITHCNFENNSATTDGGAVWLNNGNPTFRFCRFVENSAGEYGGAIEAAGSSVHSYIQDCEFIGNTANNGGAVDILTNAQLQFDHCQFFANSAPANGGALFNETSAMMVTIIQDCTFSENSALSGSAIGSTTADIEVWRSIFAFGGGGGTGFYLYDTGGDLPTIYCTDSFGNEGGNWVGNMEPLLAVNNNFSEDPQFCGGLGDGNLYLQSDSPCLPSGNDCHYQIGALPSDCGESAAKPISWTHLKSLY